VLTHNSFQVFAVALHCLQPTMPGATFSKAKMYRNMPATQRQHVGMIGSTADGQRIWKAIESCGLDTKLTPLQTADLAAQVQRLDLNEKDWARMTGPYDGASTTEIAVIKSGDARERGDRDLIKIYSSARQTVFDEVDRILCKFDNWSRMAYVKPKPTGTDPAEASLAEFADVVARTLDAIHTLQQAYAEGVADPDLTGSALQDYRDECLKALEEKQKLVAEASSRIVAVHPQLDQRVRLISKDFVHIATGHKKLYKRNPEEDSPQETYESWEDRCPADTLTYIIPDLNATEVRNKMLGNVKLLTPFADEAETIVQSASHPQMHASRVAAAMLMYTNAAKKARAILATNPTARPAVFDMGAGVFGGEKLMTLKQDPRNANVYIHAAIPMADAEDKNRVTRLRTNPTFMSWNDVSVTHNPSLHRLNWCQHKARDCTCLGNYTHVFVLCVHSAYYFTQADFARIFEHTATFESLEHIPSVGNTVPMDNPEYVWEDASQQGNHTKHSFFSRVANSFRETVTWTKQVRLQPLVTAATTYHHPDNGEKIRRGGFHPNVWAGHVDRWLETDSKLAGFAAGVVAAGAIGGLVGSMGTSVATQAAAALHGAISSAALTTAAATFVKWDTLQPRPWLPGALSVEASIASSYEVPTREQICHIVRYARVQRGTLLEPRVVEAMAVETEEVSRVAAALTTAADTDRSERMMAAVLLRDKLPAKVVRDTIRHAKTVANFLFPPPPDAHRPPWLLKGALAVVCQPFVSGISNHASSALAVALCPTRLYAPAKITIGLWTTNPVTVIYLLFAAPIHLIGLWAVLYLSDRMLTA
jgi:hypothetical protein